MPGFLGGLMNSSHNSGGLVIFTESAVLIILWKHCTNVFLVSVRFPSNTDAIYTPLWNNCRTITLWLLTGLAMRVSYRSPFDNGSGLMLYISLRNITFSKCHAGRVQVEWYVEVQLLSRWLLPRRLWYVQRVPFTLCEALRMIFQIRIITFWTSGMNSSQTTVQGRYG